MFSYTNLYLRYYQFLSCYLLSSVPFWVVEMKLPLLSFLHFLIPSTFPHDDQHISRKENLCVRIICIHILENSEILKN